jgi:hypothetical protein
MEEAVKQRLFASERAVWAATAAYFGYVVLGGLSWQLHRHIYTGDDSKSVLENLRNGQVATFRKHVYGEWRRGRPRRAARASLCLRWRLASACANHSPHRASPAPAPAQPSSSFPRSCATT